MKVLYIYICAVGLSRVECLPVCWGGLPWMLSIHNALITFGSTDYNFQSRYTCQLGDKLGNLYLSIPGLDDPFFKLANILE